MPAKEQQTSKEEMLQDSCDDPDAGINCCFVNMPANVSAILSIAGKNETGERLLISGTIYKADGKTPYPAAWLYAYHTDHTGHYTKSGKETGFQKWHGHLHGWCKTDSVGHYEIHTIRPAPYPNRSMPAHIHAAIKTTSGQAFYISDFVFKDDALVNEKYTSTLIDNVGGTGIVEIIKTTDNTWVGKRDIIVNR